MERLTKRLDNGEPARDCENCELKQDFECGDILCFERILARVADYEDSGCEPEEVLPKDKADEIALNLMRLADLESLCSYDHLRELAEADKDGRLVVLPVRPVLTQSCASMLYIVDDDEIYEDSLYEAVVGMSSSGRTNVIYTTLSDQMIFGQEAIGKTVFLTREEAEKALQEMEGKKDG